MNDGFRTPIIFDLHPDWTHDWQTVNSRAFIDRYGFVYDGDGQPIYDWIVRLNALTGLCEVQVRPDGSRALLDDEDFQVLVRRQYKAPLIVVFNRLASRESMINHSIYHHQVMGEIAALIVGQPGQCTNRLPGQAPYPCGVCDECLFVPPSSSQKEATR